MALRPELGLAIMKIIDLTHVFTDDMPVYPGDPKSSVEQIAYIEKDTFNDHRITTAMHVGTHMDAPLHMIAGGKKMAEISPDKFIGKGILIDARGEEKIDESLLENTHIGEDSVVLIYTGFGGKYRTEEYYKNYPKFTESFAKGLVELKIKIVGMDILSPDHDAPWATHKIFLGNNVLIIENLANLDQLLGVKNFEVIALPARFDTDAAPARVIAKVLD